MSGVESRERRVESQKPIRLARGALMEIPPRIDRADDELRRVARRFNLRHHPGDYVLLRSASGDERALLDGPAMIEHGQAVAEVRGFEWPVPIDVIAKLPRERR